MAGGIWVAEDIQTGLLAGLVAIIGAAFEAGKGDVQYVTGAIAMARNQALSYGLNWVLIVGSAKAALGTDAAALLDMPKVIEQH